MRYYRPTWAEIDLDNLEYNYSQIKKHISQRIKIMACVKADAYGHGIIPVSKKLASCGVNYLGVASIDEGINLRQSGIKVPILVLGSFLKKDIAPFYRFDLIPTVCTQDLAVALNGLGALKKQAIKIHLKIDTGMGRLGILHKDALVFVKKISKLKYLEIEGVFTHFPCADIDQGFTLGQLKKLEDLLAALDENGINIPLRHSANSMAVVDYRASHFDMVRPGLVLYGLNPKENLKIKFKPVLSLKTKVVFIKNVPKGCGISYGLTYVTKKKTQIATLPVGYGDGYPRNLSNSGPVLINGKRYKISGRVCMDQLMVDVGMDRVKVGDEVVLIGKQANERVTVEELAGLSSTISYEIVCGLGSRIPRVYI